MGFGASMSIDGNDAESSPDCGEHFCKGHLPTHNAKHRPKNPVGDRHVSFAARIGNY